jgi:hypothetical protein
MPDVRDASTAFPKAGRMCVNRVGVEGRRFIKVSPLFPEYVLNVDAIACHRHARLSIVLIEDSFQGVPQHKY